MTVCKCGSHAINHHCHGRDGTDGDLCDVCYWRKRAEQPAQQCKWPTCQSEEYQQALAAQIRRELVGEQPPAQRTWVGLTDEEIQTIWRSSEHMNEAEVCKAIEAKLKEKNT